MSFWGFIVLLLLLGVMIGSLFIAKKATNQELEMQEKRDRIREIRSELVDIDELIQTLLRYDQDESLLLSLANRMDKNIAEGLSLIPSSPTLLAEKIALTEIRSKISAMSNSQLEPEVPDSDQQISVVKRHFSQTMKLARELYQKGDMDDLTYGNHRSRLSLNAILLEFNAYVKQAENARADNELNMAASFYKHAKDILIKSDINIPEKNEKIKQVSKEISGLYITHDDEENSNSDAENTSKEST